MLAQADQSFALGLLTNLCTASRSSCDEACPICFGKPRNDRSFAGTISFGKNSNQDQDDLENP